MKRGSSKHFATTFWESLRPEGAIEEQLAERIALNWWRLRRVYRMEVEIAKAERQRADALAQMSLTSPRPSSGVIAETLVAGPFQSLSRYETVIERSLHRALHELERWQAGRKGEAMMAPIAVDVRHSAGDEREPATGVTGVTIEHANDQKGHARAAYHPVEASLWVSGLRFGVRGKGTGPGTPEN